MALNHSKDFSLSQEFTKPQMGSLAMEAPALTLSGLRLSLRLHHEEICTKSFLAVIKSIRDVPAFFLARASRLRTASEIRS